MTLPPKLEYWDRAWREAYEERAAIIEFCANLPRAEAERRAESDIRRVAEGKGLIVEEGMRLSFNNSHRF